MKKKRKKSPFARRKFIAILATPLLLLLLGGIPARNTFATLGPNDEVIVMTKDGERAAGTSGAQDVSEYSRPIGSLEPRREIALAKSDLVNYTDLGFPEISALIDPNFISGLTDTATDQQGRKIHFSIDKDLQRKAKEILKQNRVPWGVVVAIEPKTGKILALTSHSGVDPKIEKEILTKASFPAASLFKLVTAAAAVEQKGMASTDVVKFRGGTYTLNSYNYSPDVKRDSKSMTVGDAMGKSCNPVFARVALQNLTAPMLEQYARNFGFNMHIPFDANLNTSQFEMDDTDYAVARTAAGFGKVTISPIHAAMLAATIANGGKMMRPYLLDEIERPDGSVEYQAAPRLMRVSVLGSTARELMTMMRHTVRSGTAKSYFRAAGTTNVNTNTVAAKTGTLSGVDPKGVYRWFIATAPVNNPQIAVATLIIDPGNARIRSGAVGKKVLDYYFRS